MNGTQVTMTMLRQRLGDLVNRAAYSNERIILVSRGEPRAAIVSIADLERLQQLDSVAGDGKAEQALVAAAKIRERIRAWQESHGVLGDDVVANLNQIREERDAELSDMR